MRLLLVMLVGAVALATALGACGEGEEEIAPAPTTADDTPAATPTAAATPTPSPVVSTPAPSGTLKYVDPTYGYSFEYPADWFLYASPVPSRALGSTVTTSNFELTGTPKGGGDGQVKVDVSIWLNLEQLVLDEWIERNAASGDTVVEESTAAIGTKDGRSRTSIGGMSGAEYTQYWTTFGNYVLEIAVYFDVSVSEAARIIASFRFAE